MVMPRRVRYFYAPLLRLYDIVTPVIIDILVLLMICSYDAITTLPIDDDYLMMPPWRHIRRLMPDADYVAALLLLILISPLFA